MNRNKKLKLRKLTLLMLLVGLSDQVIAKDQEYCDAMQCEVDGQQLFTVKPKGNNGYGSHGGNATMISLPNNGMIWASENFNIGQAELSVSAPSYAAFSQGRITKPIKFYVRSNYSAFVTKYEISIYQGIDTDLVTPIATIPIDVNAITSANWSGILPDNLNLRVNDELIYVLRAYNGKGQSDETLPQKILLVTPEEEDRGISILRDDIAKSQGKVFNNDQALDQSLINEVLAGNSLARQNIPFYGSRVTVQGANIPQGTIFINGESYPIDQQRKFASDFILPIGPHHFDIQLKNEEQIIINQTLNVDITGTSHFFVGIADLTVFQNKATGAGKDLGRNGKTADILSEGRLAFYTKNKYDGRYTITAQADTKDKELKHLFSGFGRSYPEDIFRDLDPDYYYPTYGDDSSVYRDVDSMGRFYVRVDWDKSQALWGNYNTNITGTRYATYNRSLYGAALNWRSIDYTEYGDATAQVNVFASEAKSVPAHNEFLGTGGSLYYLKYGNILSGSDKVKVEIKDKQTGSTIGTVNLTRGVDYEIDAIQGRLILSRPLMQIASQNMPGIVHNDPVRGYDQLLIVDYEWVPNDFDTSSITSGGRAKYWLNDHIGIGATYIDQNDSNKYIMKGADVTLKASNATYIRAEYSQSESLGVSNFFSSNGGLSFDNVGNTTPGEKGDAKAIEARINFKEMGMFDNDAALSSWWRVVDAGFNSDAINTGRKITEYGSDVTAQLSDTVRIYTVLSEAKSGNDRYTQAQATTEWRFTDVTTIIGELKYIGTETSPQKAAGTLAAVQYRYLFTQSLEVHATGQLTLSDDHGKYKNNDAVGLGMKYLYGDLSSVGIEGTTGARGHSVSLYADHKVASDHTIYSNYTFADSRSDYDSVFNNNLQQNWTIGQRWRLTENLNMFNETQMLKGDGSGETGTANTLGFDYQFDAGLVASITYQDGRLKDSNDSDIQRKAVSGSLSQVNEIIDWSTKLEFRHDSGSKQSQQWVTINRASWKVDESLRLSAKFNYSDTDGKNSQYGDARFIDSAVGFAYRPYDNNKWAIFGRYNYFYNLAPEGQNNSDAYYDQRSQILSFEGVYKLDAKWEFASKIAYRKGEVRFDRQSGGWFNSQATLTAVQARYDIYKQWHGLLEYRQLQVKSDSAKQGWLVGIDRDISDNLRFGIGYNFTDFSDDLRNFDYKYKGFFINIVGYY